MKRKCPFCKKEIGGSSHIHTCKMKEDGLNKEEIQYKYIIFNFPQLNKENLYKEYWVNKLSYPQLKEKYGIDFKSIGRLLNYYEIEKRTVSQARHFIGNERGEKTNLKKYGKKNPLSKGTKPYKKRNETVQKRYGVDNVFQLQKVIDKIQDDNYYLEKYGLTLKKLRSKKGKEHWQSLTDEQKNFWLNRSIHSDKASKKRVGYWSSSLETEFEKMLNQYEIGHEKQFIIKNGNKNQKIKRRFFDFKLRSTNILVEIQGEYWHADPRIYKEDDLIFEHNNIKTAARDLWKRDEEKRSFAESYGYNVVYIWEKEIKESSISELRDLFFNKLKEKLDEESKN